MLPLSGVPWVGLSAVQGDPAGLENRTPGAVRLEFDPPFVASALPGVVLGLVENPVVAHPELLVAVDRGPLHDGPVLVGVLGLEPVADLSDEPGQPVHGLLHGDPVVVLVPARLELGQHRELARVLTQYFHPRFPGLGLLGSPVIASRGGGRGFPEDRLGVDLLAGTRLSHPAYPSPEGGQETPKPGSRRATSRPRACRPPRIARRNWPRGRVPRRCGCPSGGAG